MQPFATVTDRIIPARAGSSSRKARSVTRDADHPRACGEQAVATSLAQIMGGSSPRVRGADDLTDVSQIYWMDHPRACGEQVD